jgi:hypothetical protein
MIRVNPALVEATIAQLGELRMTRRPSLLAERRRLDRELAQLRARNGHGYHEQLERLEARQLALAYHIDGLVRSGQVANFAAVAGTCGVSRARVSYVMALLWMPLAAQETILLWGDRAPHALSERAAPSGP